MPANTSVFVFPFDLFGSPGSGNGARLLCDAIREMVADNQAERKKTRADAYTKHIRIRETSFDNLQAFVDWRDRGCQLLREAIQRKEFIIWVTGNHLGTLPVYEEAAELATMPLFIQLDAHLDIYNLADCTAELSHGNFLLHSRRALPPIVNVGARELLLRPDYIKRYYQAVFTAEQIACDFESVIAKLASAVQKSNGIFIDIDCDAIDPSFFPAVANPLPFGLSPQQLLRCVNAVWSEKVVGVSIAEFDPSRDQNDRSLGLLIWLMEYLLLRRYE